ANLETARQEEERRRKVAESLRGVLTILNSTRSPRDVLLYIVRQVEELLGSAAAVIYGPAHLTDTVTVQTQPETPDAAHSGNLVTTLRVQAADGLQIGWHGARPSQHITFVVAAVAQALAFPLSAPLVARPGLCHP